MLRRAEPQPRLKTALRRIVVNWLALAARETHLNAPNTSNHSKPWTTASFLADEEKISRRRQRNVVEGEV